MKTSKGRIVKAWGIKFFETLDSDMMKYGGQSYTAFISEADARKWLGDERLYHKIVPITLHIPAPRRPAKRAKSKT